MTEKDIEWAIRSAYEWDGKKYRTIDGRIAKKASKSIYKEYKKDIRK